MGTNRRPVGKLVIATLSMAALLTTACSDDGDERSTTTTPPSTTAADTTADHTDAPDFCDEAPDTGAEVPESYVGSAEHVGDLRRLREVAPGVLADDLDLIVNHFDEAVDPSEPDSQLMQNFPDEVNEATGRVAAFIQENCGP